MRKNGQIWVETVIYTLIGLAIIGLVLSTALPKINQKKDSIAIEQSIGALMAIDNKIYQTQVAVGNRRVVDLDIGKGTLIIDMERDEIVWVLDSSFEYSEVDFPVSLGKLNVTTRKVNPFEVELKIAYNLDIRFDGNNAGTKEIGAAPTPYRLIIENAGISGSEDIIIELSVI